MENRQRIAIVTGANKGIGLEISRQLSENGILVVLTARDEVRGQAAVKKLQDVGVKEVIFHQLDISDPASITCLKEFVKTKFGKLDILVNNAGVGGVELQSPTTLIEGDSESLFAAINETYEMSKECIDINYYGTKAMCEAFIPLLHQSKSPRIVNVSATFGKLLFIPGDSIRKELRNIDNLAEDRLEELMESFLVDCKEGRLKESGWPDRAFSAYKVSKNAVNAYTRILAKNYPKFIVNCVCPGYVKTDLTYNTGTLTVEEGAKGPVMLALLPDGSPSGQFYNQTEPTSFE
ncbi:hypothetical protein LUZ63_001917 [Rhynchospora breviuscula]|uniref:Short-chain dehydrogenase/reductase n=1 Tax=Rhynchospora breviuscula TaxID=2022672 RepID=A0A9Q0CYA6_9POAL|nr:hypothetical protein LUZ63_001917 [Rhynchospora breviuscula]